MYIFGKIIAHHYYDLMDQSRAIQAVGLATSWDKARLSDMREILNIPQPGKQVSGK
jgi:hypothetical protein